MSLIKCDGVNLAYEGNTVVTDLTFYVEEGNYICIVGENGSGKSTLIKALLGLKKPESGTITYGDGLKQNEIGYLSQQSAAQRDFPASVREVVLSGCLNRGGFHPFFTKAEKKRAEENMERLGITHLANRCYRELSGGQQQRTLLCRALCATHRLLLLDEPTAGLDPIATDEMYTIIRKLNREDGITVIMVTHDTHSAFNDATHILHLDNRCVFFGKTGGYLSSGAARRFLEGRRHG